MKKTLLLIGLAVLSLGLFAQGFDLPCGNVNYKPEVQTVLLYADGNQLNEPVVPLDDMMGRLTLSFDVLNGQGDVLNYTFIHCSNDWFPTDIQRTQFASGFESDRIDDYAFSRNTLVDYVNYQLVFPSEDLAPLISGNYLLIVYGDDMSEQNLYLTRRFMVVDEKAKVAASVPRYPDDLVLTDTHQQLDVRVVMGNITTSNVQQYTNLTIRQNGRIDNMVEGLKPSFVYPDYLSYEHDPSTVFPGTNQFRRFNICNFYFQSENLAHIRQTDDYYEVDIATLESRARMAYGSYEDIHGEKVIYVEKTGEDPSTEADYARVNFFYECETPYPDQEVYLMGAFNDWQFNDRNCMEYDTRFHGYFVSLLLKQGYYNFMVTTLDRNSMEVSTELTAGNFWETDNVYHLYFYHFNAVKGYDELIGYSVVNSH